MYVLNEVSIKINRMSNILNQNHDVVANVLNCDIAVKEFELQSHYYIHFYLI